MIPLAFGVFGLIVGSFLNVLVIRHGVRGIGGRSACMTCGKRLTWPDMIPVVSWLMLSGKCRHCFARISVQYPLVEAGTAILFAFLGYWVLFATHPYAVPLLIVYMVIGALLIAIAAYDMRHTIIPDPWVWTFNALTLFSALAFPLQATSYWLPALLAGPIAASPLFAFWLFSRGRWMGLGDAKLALGIGWLLGPTMGIIAVFFAFVLGAVISVCVLLPLPHIIRTLYTLGITSQNMPRGGFTMRSEIPFGPFLICSCIIIWLCLLYGVDPLVGLGLSSLTTVF